MTKGHYKPREKKPVKQFTQTRLIRIDARTQIEVPVGITDDEAIERYYQRHKTAVRPPISVQTEDEIEVEQEELALAVVDDSDLPEE